MKLFHRMTLRMLPAPFLAWLLVLLFLLVMQFLIKYLPQLVGKGLPFMVVVELIMYNVGYMLVLAIPMAALIATLMTFGRLAESNAWAVIKGSGVSFPQLVWPVWLVGALLAGGMWYFNTEVHPESNFRAFNLWQDIRLAKPGFDLKAGVMYDGLEEYRILVRDIPEDEPNTLHDVYIFDYSSGSRLRTDISAVRGHLETLHGGRTLQLTLFDGEVHRRIPPERYERMSFKRHVIRIPLDDLNFERNDPGTGNRTDRTMRAADMRVLVDSLRHTAAVQKDELGTLLGSLGTGTASRTEWVRTSGEGLRTLVEQNRDSTRPETAAEERELARMTARAHRASTDAARRTVEIALLRADRYAVEIHKKYSMAVACLLFMMLGAPLGLAIRRGGLGMSAVVAMTIFLIHWVSLANGEKFADRGLLDPWLGMWAADIITGLFALAVTVHVWRDMRATPLRKRSGS
jgi:lipopolysaccharide export system permease protein